MSHVVTHRSRSRIPDFVLLRPRSLDEARKMLDGKDSVMAMGGGLDIINRMKEGLAPQTLVMLDGIEGFDIIQMSDDRNAVEIGAGTCHDALANSVLLRERLPDLARCWERIANVRIRMQGTVAGNLLALMPGYEGAALLSALDARFLYSTRDQRHASIAVDDFDDASESFFQSRGLVKAVSVPLPTTGMTRRLIYDRDLRPALSVALSIDHAQGVVARARAVVGGCHRWPFARDLAVAGLSMSTLHARADQIALAAVRQMPAPTVPWFGVPNYRETVAPVLLSRLIRKVAS